MQTRVPLRITFDTNVIRELYEGRRRASVVRELLLLAESIGADVAVTAKIDADVADGELRQMIDRLPELGIRNVPAVGRWDEAVWGVSIWGSNDFVDEWDEAVSDFHSTHPGWVEPDERDQDHLHSHFALGRDFFVTMDRAVLVLGAGLHDRLGVQVFTPEDALARLADR